MEFSKFLKNSPQTPARHAADGCIWPHPPGKNTPMPASAPNWIDWFDSESVFADAVSEKHADVFVRSTQPLLKYGGADVVLDVGCGRGLLADRIHARVAQVHCADTSRSYVEYCRRTFAGNPKVFTHLLDPGDYTNL